MILADKISQLRKAQNWSQEDLAYKLGVSRQSVSKWEQGTSIPDLDKIIKLSQIFDVSCDYLLKDQNDSVIEDEQEQETIQRFTLSLEDAVAYIQLRRKAALWMGLGVLLCIIAVIPLVILDAFTLHETVKNAFGLSFLFISVGCAVGLFVLTHLRLSPYEQIYHHKELSFQYGVDGYLQKEKQAFQPKYHLFIILGIILILFAFIPLFVIPAIFSKQFEEIGIGFTIGIISIGVFLIIYAYTCHASFSILYQEGDYMVHKKDMEDEKTHNVIGGIYWPLVTAVYLGVSFLNSSWHISWVIWPIAACLYSPIVIISKQITKK